MDREIVRDEITLPACWQDLVDVVFPDDLEGVENGDVIGKSVAIDDPNPYYDDHRSVKNELKDGATLVTTLASGQKNYWASHRLNLDGEYVDTEPFSHFPENEELTIGNLEYRLEINWLEDFSGEHPESGLSKFKRLLKKHESPREAVAQYDLQGSGNWKETAEDLGMMIEGILSGRLEGPQSKIVDLLLRVSEEEGSLNQSSTLQNALDLAKAQK